MENATSLLILALVAITFLQSGYDKIKDWKGNLAWLNGHFKGSFFENKVSYSLFIILILEIIAGVFCIAGGIEILMNNNHAIAKIGLVLAGITLLMLLFGQRIAKDYDGARTIVIYFIPVILGLYLLT